jgi:hypothetical protein
MEREADRDSLPGAEGSADTSIPSLGSDLAAEALVGCSSLDLEDLVREEGGRCSNLPRERNAGTG